MKIAMVSEHANPLAALGGHDAGGQNVHVAALAGRLARLGDDVTVFTRRDSAGAPARVRAPEGYVVELVPAGPPTEVPKDELLPHLPAFAEYLLERWAAERFDVVHSHFWMSGLVAVAAARELGIPVVHTFHALGSVKRRHQGAEDTSPAQRIRLESELCRELDHVIATCDDEVAELGALGMDVRRVTVVPCGVDVQLFHPAPTPATRRAGRPPRLLTVGRLVPRKGTTDLVEALAQLPEAELSIVGGPAADSLALDPDVNRIRAAAERHGVADRVQFAGGIPQQQMPERFWDADVVVTVPWYEPFGIVPLEAMACGRPVVGTAVGGLLDTVVPGSTGELVPPRDPNALARVLRELLADPERLARYGQAGPQRVRRRYRWQQVAVRTRQVYASVTAGRRSEVAS